MLTKDYRDDVQCMTGVLPVRFRIFDHDGKHVVLATSASPIGHLLNRHSTWIASTAVANLNVPKSMIFIVAYRIDAGGDKRWSIFEHKFRWIGKMAIERVSVSILSLDEFKEATGYSLESEVVDGSSLPQGIGQALLEM